MKLIIIRDQSKGLMGGNKFEFTARVQLTPAETDLVNKYNAGREVLMSKSGKLLTIGSLMKGENFKCNSIAEILEYEVLVKKSCAGFKNYLDVMSRFGGEEVIEFGPEGDVNLQDEALELEDSEREERRFTCPDCGKEADFRNTHEAAKIGAEAARETLDFCYHCGEEVQIGKEEMPALWQESMRKQNNPFQQNDIVLRLSVWKW